MKIKSKSFVSIISSSDGPTSIFIVGKSEKRPLKIRIKSCIYRYKHKRAEKKVIAEAHTLKEVIEYAMEKYNAMEVNTKQNIYLEEFKSLKERLIIREKPELLVEIKAIEKPDIYNTDSIREFQNQIRARMEKIAEIPDSEIPMDFHLYQIQIDDNYLEIKIDYHWDVFSVSYSGNKKVMKLFKKISRDLYIYYGVKKEDITNKSERYSSLLTNLST